MKKELIMMRGLPGSGKSFYAKRLAESIPGAGEFSIFSTDDWFMVGGVYQFDASKLGEAHDHTKESVKFAMAGGARVIIVDNTNTRFWEMAAYFEYSRSYNYKVSLHYSPARWAWDVEECARRNTHGVPLETIQQMRDRFEF